MAHPETLERLVRRVAAQVRRRRVEHYALRGAFWSCLVAVLVLLFKHPLGAWALPLAGGALVAGTLGGAVWGALRRTPVADAARLADRTWEAIGTSRTSSRKPITAGPVITRSIATVRTCVVRSMIAFSSSSAG